MKTNVTYQAVDCPCHRGSCGADKPRPNPATRKWFHNLQVPNRLTETDLHYHPIQVLTERKCNEIQMPITKTITKLPKSILSGNIMARNPASTDKIADRR